MPTTLPAQADPQTILRVRDDLIREALPERHKRDDENDKNLRLYEGDHWDTNPPAGLKHFTINRTQRAIVASAAVQTEQRPQTLIQPVESNEPAIVYFTDSGSILAEQNGVQIAEPFDEMTMQQLLMMTVPQEVTNSNTDTTQDDTDEESGPVEETTEETVTQIVQVPVFSPQDFITIDDSACAEAVQRVHDILWDKAMADAHWFDNILMKLILGYQAMLIQWDDEGYCYDLTNLHPKNILIDPTANGIEDADYFILFDPVSVDEATKRFPEHAEAIEQEKTTENVGHVSTVGEGVTLGAPWNETHFERDMVLLQTMWLRHAELPMSPEEASRKGLVTPAMSEVLDESGMPQAGPDGQPMSRQIEIEGQPVFQTQDGALTQQGDDKWPTKYGIRQIQFVGNTVVSDMECPYSDIPIIWNKNLPIPFRPWGQGEPTRLWSLQDAVNRVASILHNHLRYYQSPQEYIPQSVKDAMKDDAPHSHPGRRVTVADDAYMRFLQGGRGFVVDPPTLPATYVDYFMLLLRLMDEESDNSEVLQGRVPTGVESGRAIESLQTAARGSIGFKALGTERAMTYAARLVLNMIVDFLPESEWVKMVGQYPPEILIALRERAKNLKYDVRVEVVSGKGASRRARQADAMQEYQMGLRGPTSTMKVLEIANIEKEIQDIMQNPISPMAQMSMERQQQLATNAPNRSGSDNAA